MNTNDVAINTRIELNRQGVSFQDAIVALSTSIASIYPLIGMKGRKALVSETNTGDSAISHKSHLNGVSFTDKDWKRHFKNDEFRCIPNQVRKLIGFAKHHDYDQKQAVLSRKLKRKEIRGEDKLQKHAVSSMTLMTPLLIVLFPRLLKRSIPTRVTMHTTRIMMLLMTIQSLGRERELISVRGGTNLVEKGGEAP